MSVETIGGNCLSLQHLPIGSLKCYGTNPYGESMFRVIWSESRQYLVGARHCSYDGDPSKDSVVGMRGKDPNLMKSEIGYRWLPLYPGRGRWVLEMWKSPMAATGCTPEQYEIQYRDFDTGLLTLGPYPSRGEYYQCHEWNRVPTISEVIERIYLIRAGWNYSYSEKLVANREALQKQEKDKFNQFQAMFKDSQQAFGNNPSNVRPGKRTKERVNLSRTAEQAGLNRGGFSSSLTPSVRSRSRHARNNRTA